MAKKAFFTLSVSVIFVFATTIAQAQVGITSVPFLQIEPDSRAAGMGNAGVALADNASAVFWNPAGLGFQQGSQVSLTHSEWLPKFNADLFYDYLVGRYQLEGAGTLGAHITYLNLGEQLHTTIQNPTGEGLGRFNSYEFSAGLAYGHRLNERWALGGGLRFIYSSLFEGELGQRSVSPGSSFGVDLAALYRSEAFELVGRPASLQAGLNLSNLGPGIRYTSNARKDPLPTVLRAGWALTLQLDASGVNTLTLANDISKIMARSDSTGQPEGALRALLTSWGPLQRDTGQGSVRLSTLQQLMVATGLEYWYDKLFALRAGYYYEDPHNGDRQYLTLGAGIRYDFIGVDFSYIYTLNNEEHPLANTTRFGLLLNF